MIRSSLTCLALSVLLGALPAVPAGAQAPRGEEKPAIKAKEDFHVYGGSCRRSWRLLGSYESADRACWAAQDFRRQGLKAEVTTGTDGKLNLGQSPREYKVYVNPCKVWFLHTTTVDLKTAQGVAEVRTKGGDNVEIVQHYVLN